MFNLFLNFSKELLFSLQEARQALVVNEMFSWWRHQMETFSGPGEFPAQRPVTRSFDVYFDLRRN